MPEEKKNLKFIELNKNHATKSQAEDLWQTASSAFGKESPWTVKQYQETLAAENAMILAAVLSDRKARDVAETVGFLIASKTLIEVDIYLIAVAKKYQQRGIARDLLKKLAELAINKELETIFLEVRESNQAAYQLYHRFGFQEIGRRKAYYSSPIEDALMMKLDLKNFKE